MKNTRVVAILVLAIVVTSGAGYYALFQRELGQSLNYTTERTIASSSFVSSVTPTDSWITVSATQPISYYLRLLEQNKTEPYSSLAKELRALPDLLNASAIAQIVSLALNASNSEVKEALGLMIKGGTPDPNDFSYSVPKYNTELEVLYWLACQNEFKKDDTLALSVAMANGLWATVGDEQAREALRKDTSDLLAFFRETNELQKQRGYFQLEHYPLEAKLCLVWTSNRAILRGPYNFYFHNPRTMKASLDIYEWNNVRVDTLRKMRQEMMQRQWIAQDPNSIISKLVNRFWGGFGPYVYDLLDEYVGKGNYDPDTTDTFANIDLLFDLYEHGSVSRLNCADLTTFVDSWEKSWGIAALTVWQIDGRLVQERKIPNGHIFLAYFDPYRTTWTAYQRDFADFQNWSPPRKPDDPHKFHVFVIPVDINNPPWTVRFYGTEFEKCTFLFVGKGTTTIPEMQKLFLDGIPTQKMKQWLLYD